MFLNFEKDKENNIKQNENNLINYFDILDLWDITTFSKENFKEELNNIKQLNIKVNLSLYDVLVDDINSQYFEEVQKEIDKEKESQKIIEKEKFLADEVIENIQDNTEKDEDSIIDYGDKNEENEE